MIGDLLNLLNDNSGALAALAAAVSAVATVVYVVLTLALLRESRALRQEAHVEALPQPWDLAPDQLIVEFVNHGPALAYEIEFVMELCDPSGHVLTQRRHAQVALSPGAGRRFLADIDDQHLPMDKLIERAIDLRLSWTWQDGRRSWRGVRKTWMRSVSRSVASIADDFRGGAALVEPEIPREIKKIRETLEKLAKKS